MVGNIYQPGDVILLTVSSAVKPDPVFLVRVPPHKAADNYQRARLKPYRGQMRAIPDVDVAFGKKYAEGVRRSYGDDPADPDRRVPLNEQTDPDDWKEKIPRDWFLQLGLTWVRADEGRPYDGSLEDLDAELADDLGEGSDDDGPLDDEAAIGEDTEETSPGNS